MDGNISPQSLGYNDSTLAATHLTYVRGKRLISFPLSEKTRRGCGRSTDTPPLLEKLLRTD